MIAKRRSWEPYTSEQLEKKLKDLSEDTWEIMVTKGKEYQGNEGDRLGNFRRIAAELNASPELIIWVYLKKHMDSLAFHIRYIEEHEETKPSSESLESRIHDALNYLMLLAAQIDARRRSDICQYGAPYNE